MMYPHILHWWRRSFALFTDRAFNRRRTVHQQDLCGCIRHQGHFIRKHWWKAYESHLSTCYCWAYAAQDQCSCSCRTCCSRASWIYCYLGGSRSHTAAVYNLDHRRIDRMLVLLMSAAGVCHTPDRPWLGSLQVVRSWVVVE